MKVRAVLGPESSDDKEISILNRVVRWAEDCLLYEADPRHVEKLLKECDMEGCKSLTTPGVKEASSTSMPAWFEQQPDREEEDLEESEIEDGGCGGGHVTPGGPPVAGRELTRERRFGVVGQQLHDATTLQRIGLK